MLRQHAYEMHGLNALAPMVFWLLFIVVSSFVEGVKSLADLSTVEPQYSDHFRLEGVQYSGEEKF